MTVTCSVCVSGAGIDYSRVTSVSYTYSDFYIKPAVFGAVGWGYAGPAVGLCLPRCKDTRQRSRCHRFGAGVDSFLGFEYVVMITLASRVFEYFLSFLLQACVICAF